MIVSIMDTAGVLAPEHYTQMEHGEAVREDSTLCVNIKHQKSCIR